MAEKSAMCGIDFRLQPINGRELRSAAYSYPADRHFNLDIPNSVTSTKKARFSFR
jgi:hypothetical protein